MNGAQVIGLARHPLADTETGFYRYSDETLLDYLRLAYDLLKDERPDVFIGRLVTDTTQPIALTTDLSFLPRHYLQKLADAVAARALLHDDELAGDGGKAQMLLLLAKEG